jgi:hypothetical protein
MRIGFGHVLKQLGAVSENEAHLPAVGDERPPVGIVASLDTARAARLV